MEKTNKDNIFVFQPTENELNTSLNESFKYAIYSIPFTINRMNINLMDRIKNIIKGKLAENLLFCFLKRNDIHFISTSTPYYQIDKKDFILLDYEWDIKNNFFYCSDALENLKLIEEFYGLIPNRHFNDQWNKTFNLIYSDYNPAILFTFMYKFNLDVDISDELKNYLKISCNIYQGIPLDNTPNKYEYELNQLMNKQVPQCYIKSEYDIKLFITGIVTGEEKNHFFDFYPYMKFPKSNDCFTSRIKNKAILINKTNSFISLLKDNRLL